MVLVLARIASATAFQSGSCAFGDFQLGFEESKPAFDMAGHHRHTAHPGPSSASGPSSACHRCRPYRCRASRDLPLPAASLADGAARDPEVAGRTPASRPGPASPTDAQISTSRMSNPYHPDCNRTPGCVALSDQNELVQSFAKTQSLQRYSRTCSGDSDSANTVTRYCAIGFSRDRNITCHERATFNKGLLASIAKSR